MSEPTFQPWIGPAYETEGYEGVRLLMLGESHYGKLGTEAPDKTREVVRKIARDNKHSFFTKSAKLALGLGKGKSLSMEKRNDFWDRVAFYNYVQEYIDEDARGSRPTPKMWTEAEAPFRNVVQKLKPDAVLVLGKDLGKHLPELSDFDFESCIVTHPSSGGFRYKDWMEDAQAMLQRAKS